MVQLLDYHSSMERPNRKKDIEDFIKQDFKYFVNHLHGLGIGVVLDWVPGHFPTDDFALARYDGSPLYEYADPRKGFQPDWNTYIFDYGRNEV